MPNPYFTEVSQERAYDLAEELGPDRTDAQANSMTVISGTHPTLGPIHITIPLMGNTLLLPALLPVVTRKFDD